ncbi:MAG: bifunctional pyr operon transcriptional regulator/uracil phosphoribosyltransferase PyrR [Chitinophagaceae bacterium]|nr:bifunctional pyr operon transcriptional regulator/uracil phosphoribosyltransferase PyrR [Chitinophagaceae bacterium]
MKVLLSGQQLIDAAKLLAEKLLSAHPTAENVVFVGIQQGGVVVANKIVEAIREMQPAYNVQYGQLDITFYRDDIRQKIIAPDTMNIPFAIESKIVVLIDDVLFTGRTIKAALDVLLDYGRPARVELCVLADRKEHRQFPIQADYAAYIFETKKTDKVKLIKNVDGKLEVVLLTEN